MKKILVVDGDPTTRELLLRALSINFTFQGLEAGTGLEAIWVARLKRPDLILLNVAIPGGINGFEVCRLLKSDEATCHAAVIIVTENTTESDIRYGVASGADDYCGKPVSVCALLNKAARLLYRHRVAELGGV